MIAAVVACGGTTAKTSSLEDGGAHELPPTPIDSSDQHADVDGIVCECPTIECPAGSQLSTPAGACCPECVRCDYSQCAAPQCGLGSWPRTSPNSCCAECEPQACPSIDYQGLQLCGIDEPTLVTACSYILSQHPPDPVDIDVLVNCEFTTRPRYGDGGAVLAGDWVLNAATNPPTLRIVGALCDFITREPTADVHVLYGCPVI
jgi:hypothetical protein